MHEMYSNVEKLPEKKRERRLFLLFIPLFFLFLIGSAYGASRLLTNGNAPGNDIETAAVTYKDAYNRDCNDAGECIDERGRTCSIVVDGTSQCIGVDGRLWVCKTLENGVMSCSNDSGMICTNYAGLQMDECVDASQYSWYCTTNMSQRRDECMRSGGEGCEITEAGAVKCKNDDESRRSCSVNNGQLECSETADNGNTEVCRATDILNIERCIMQGDDDSSEEILCTWGSGADDKRCGENGKEPLVASVNYSTILPTAGNVYVTISANKSIQVPSGWQRVNDAAVGKIFDKNSSETVLVVGGAETAELMIVVSNIDKTLPNIEVLYSSTAPTRESVVVTIRSDESLPTPDGWAKVSDREFTKSFDNNFQGVVMMTDNKGHKIAVPIFVNNIDRDTPTVSISYSPEGPTNSNVTVTIRANEDVVVPHGWTRSANMLANEIKKVFTENAGETVRIVDMAGNATDVTATVNNIDKTAPKVSNLKYSETDSTKNDVTAIFEVNEDCQTPDGWEQDGSPRKFKRTFSANWSGNVVVRDLAGNTATVHVQVTNIDKAPLTMRLAGYTPVFGGATGKLESVTIVVEISKSAGNISGGMNGWTQVSDTMWTKTFGANVNETIAISDRVGNTVSYKLQITGIGEYGSVIDASPPSLNKQ